MAGERETETIPDPSQEMEPVVETEVVAPQAVDNDDFEGMIAKSKRLNEIAEAKDKFRKFILARALKNDWMQFGDKLELGHAGTGRIGSDLGVSYTNWKSWRETGKDERGEYVRWFYSCTANCSGRVLEHVIGRADSRQKFFGHAHGKDKQLHDINESDIRVAAWRAAMKESVKQMFGLHSIPVEQAEELGLDPKKIKKVRFDENEKSNKADEGKTEKIVAKLVGVGQRNTKTGKTVYVVNLDHKEVPKADTFSETMAKEAKSLAGKTVEVKVTKTRWGHNLQEIEEHIDFGGTGE